jgi:hypothetical protein
LSDRIVRRVEEVRFAKDTSPLVYHDGHYSRTSRPL